MHTPVAAARKHAGRHRARAHGGDADEDIHKTDAPLDDGIDAPDVECEERSGADIARLLVAIELNCDRERSVRSAARARVRVGAQLDRHRFIPVDACIPPVTLHGVAGLRAQRDALRSGSCVNRIELARERRRGLVRRTEEPARAVSRLRLRRALRLLLTHLDLKLHQRLRAELPNVTERSLGFHVEQHRFDRRELFIVSRVHLPRDVQRDEFSNEPALILGEMVQRGPAHDLCDI